MTASPVRIASDALSATIAPMGAELQTLTTGDGAELLWNGDAAWWTGRSPVLFPIVGRAPEDRIAIGDFTAPMAQHGFARRTEFELADTTATSCRHILRDSEATRAVYPFAFELAQDHALDGATLSVTTKVTNTGTDPMPFGLGFHPAFAWPLPGAAGQPHAITLDNSAEPVLARIEDGLLPDSRLPSPFTNGRMTLSHDQFKADAMIFPEGAGKGLRYGPDSGPALQFTFKNLPNLALWQKPGAPFLCVEPWHGMTARKDAGHQITDRPGTLTLAPGTAARFSWSVTWRP